MSPSSKKTGAPIRTVVTAGSALAVGQLVGDLSKDPSLQISFANSAAHLLQQIDISQPSVVLLDTRIAADKTPQLVETLIRRGNLQVLIRTEADETSSSMLLDCIDAGALAILNKPASTEQTAHAIPSLIWNIKAAGAASAANLSAVRSLDWPLATGSESNCIFAIGAGMGGAFVLGKVLAQLPAGSPGAMVVTPLPRQLITAWTDRLNGTCQVRIKPAIDGDTIQTGQILVAPGDGHVMLRRTNNDWTVKIKDGPAVFNQKPSIEVLFNSIAESAAPNVVGLLLSGAGVDGIAGLLKLRKTGGRTLTESTGIFPELSTRAVQCGAAETHVTANQLAGKMLEFASARQMPQAA